MPRASKRPAGKARAPSKKKATLPTAAAKSIPVERKLAQQAKALQALRDQLEQRASELAVIDRIQEGMASALDFQAIVDLVGDKIREVFKSGDVTIGWRDTKDGRVHPLYAYEHGKRLQLPAYAPRRSGVTARVLKERRPAVGNNRSEQKALGMRLVPGTDPSQSCVFVPILGKNRALGLISLEDHERENAFGEAEVRLLSTVAASMGVALENARLFDETQQRNAELAVINSIQHGIASKLDFQGIIDLVGDKLREVFHTGDLAIRWWDEKAGVTHWLYSVEHGKHLQIEPTELPPTGPTRQAITTRQAQVANTRDVGSTGIPGTDMSRCMAVIPIIGSDRVLGTIQLENHEREDAFGDAEVRLLTTVAASMGVALESARNFAETQRLLKETAQRNAELAVINSIQHGVSAQLDFQKIIDLVGDKLREVFNTGDISIRWWDEKAALIHTPYGYEHGVRFQLGPRPVKPDSLPERVLRGREIGLVNTVAEAKALGIKIVPGTDTPLSTVRVPIVAGDHALGYIMLENYEREYAFGEAEIRLLSTVASGMGVALENARLFDETQRLLKETEQRNAELAIINSVQEGLASKLEIDAIYTLVGDKIREIFAADTTYIAYHDIAHNEIAFPYYIDRGTTPSFIAETKGRLPYRRGLSSAIIESGKSLLLPTLAEQYAHGGIKVASPGTTEDMNSTFLGVPIFLNGKPYGVVSVQSYKEHAYDENDVRLLGTLARTMSVALENARLFDETQRLFKAEQERVAELAVINSIQQGVAGSLEFQAIVDLVGGKLREVLHIDEIGIRWYDHEAQLIHYLYEYEHGSRLTVPPGRIRGSHEQIIATRQPILLRNRAEMEASGMQMVPGTDSSLCILIVPIMASDRVLGSIIFENFQREDAFGESVIRLLQTVASSMGVALENARLYKESEQRAAELAIINSVQEALAAELNIQGIYDAVGDKIREIFNQADVGIRLYEPQTGLVHFPYFYEGGIRIHPDSMPLPAKGFGPHVFRTRETLVINSNMAEASEKYGSGFVPGTTRQEKASVFVPLVSGDQARGLIQLTDMERENAFSESDVRLLQTLAGAMSVRLYKESEQRAAELAIINSVQQALAAELNIQGIYDAVGDKVREIFHQADMGIRVYDPRTGLVHYPYVFEKGRRINVDSHLIREAGFGGHVLRTRETLVINENMEQESVRYGSSLMPASFADPSEVYVPQATKSGVWVPMVAGDQARGLIELHDYEREHAFSDSDVRLLQTLANSMSVALASTRRASSARRSSPSSTASSRRSPPSSTSRESTTR